MATPLHLAVAGVKKLVEKKLLYFLEIAFIFATFVLDFQECFSISFFEEEEDAD